MARVFALRASFQGQDVVIKRGESQELGPLTIHLVMYDGVVNSGFSDLPAHLWFGVFRRP